LQAQTFQTPALAAFDIEVDANSCFRELLLAVATVDVACRYCTLAIGAGNGVYVANRLGANFRRPNLGLALLGAAHLRCEFHFGDDSHIEALEVRKRGGMVC
jgi:hypothetical protein